MTDQTIQAKKHRTRLKKRRDVTNVLYIAPTVPFFHERFVIPGLISTFVYVPGASVAMKAPTATNDLLKTKSV